jgi:hypothetical protein
LFQPAALGDGDTLGATVKGTGIGCSVKVALAEEVFPAWSIAVPLIVCRPAVTTVTGEGHTASPDKLSEQLKVTSALVALTTPFASGVGRIKKVMTGGVLSILMPLRVVLALLPALSVAEPEAL